MQILFKRAGYHLLLLLAPVVLSFNSLSAQQLTGSPNDYSILLPEGMVHFELNRKKIMVELAETLSENQKADFNSDAIKMLGIFKRTELASPAGTSVLELSSAMDSVDYFKALEQLLHHPAISYAAPVLIYRNKIEEIPYGMLYVKLKSAGDLTTLMNYSKAWNFDVDKQAGINLYFCHVTKNTGRNSMEVAKSLQQLHAFEYVEPDFIYFCKTQTNDPYFGDQWYLLNTAQPPFTGAIAGDDIDIVNAWTINAGSPSVKVAILDIFGDTAQFEHPDFAFDELYDATGTGFTTEYPANPFCAHGLACGGIVGAITNNRIGIAGIAYNSKVEAVKIGNFTNADSGSWQFTGNSVYDGIVWAYQNASVISNSNTYGSSSSMIDEAIENAVSLGRSGKGTLFFSSTGNDDASSIAYPGSNPFAIAVGGTTFCDTRKSEAIPDCTRDSSWGANYGTGIDVSAPCEAICTIDIVGKDGFCDEDYCYVSGTSASCPIAAGIMALILSEDSNLSYICARQALESTCNKVGGYSYTSIPDIQPNGTWCPELGYGRVNALQALQYVQSGSPACTASPAFKSNVFVYPNPSRSVIHIDANPLSLVSVTLVDMTGRIVISHQLASNLQSLDISSCSAGIYLLKMQLSDGSSAVQRVVKQ